VINKLIACLGVDEFIKGGWLPGLLLLLLLSACHTNRKPDPSVNPPNILFVVVDDLNDWIGSLEGHPNARTPNLDRLVNRSVLFTNAHCQAPICGPSRASFLSGLLPSSTGVYGQIKSKELIKNIAIQKIKFLPEYFAEHGYKTMGIGKIFHDGGGINAFQGYGGRLGGFGPKPKERMSYIPNLYKGRGTQTDWGAFPELDAEMPDYQISAWAAKKLEENHSQPFFLAVGFYRPHVPWHVPQSWFDRHPLEQVKEPEILNKDLDDLPEISLQVHEMPMMPPFGWMRDQDRIAKATQAYLASVTFVDHQIGKVIQALEDSPHADNTIVVLLSDHGYHMGEKHRWAKHSLWEEATKVPLMIHLPDMKMGTKCEQPVGLIDLYPTLVQLCRLPENPLNEGRSLVSLIQQPATLTHHAVLTTYGRNNHAVRTDRYRYIHYENGSEELYDHQNDPQEWTNLAAEPQHKALKESLKAFLPKENVIWDKNSELGINPYFEKHISEN
jgi:arylsulfatase A-like enzyme